MASAAPERRRKDACRLLVAAPAVLLSTVLVTFPLGGLGQWALIAVAGWVLCAPLLRQRRVERFVVRTVFQFRPPTGRDAEWLKWLRAGCERAPFELVYAPGTGEFDWYVIEDARPNACAAGAHSIAITTGLLHRAYAGHLTPDELIAVALHEMGHHAAGDVRHGLVVWWLTWPWRAVRLFAVRLGHRISLSGVGALLAPVVVIVAICRAATGASAGAHAWWTVAVLGAVLLAVYVQPVVEAALNRGSERAADAFVMSLGLGSALASARQQLDCTRPQHRCRPRSSMPVGTVPARHRRWRFGCRYTTHRPLQQRRHRPPGATGERLTVMSDNATLML